MASSLKIVFAGTPDFAAKHLQALIDSSHQVVAVYCPPDKPSGRGKKLQPCPVKQLAQENNISVEQPLNFKKQEDLDQLKTYQADVMVVVAYGLLLPLSVLETPRLGCINVHGSLLPKWRGAAPIQRSLEAGDAQTGVTIMQMNEGLDTGDMLLKSSCEITDTDTSASLYDKLAELGPGALLTVLEQMASNSHNAIPQDDMAASYAKKLDKSEAEIDWHLPAKIIHQKIRAYIPWPVAQFTLHENDTFHAIRVWQASVELIDTNAAPGTILHSDKTGIVVATGNNALRLTSLQLPGKKALPVVDILNARADWFKANQAITGIK